MSDITYFTKEQKQIEKWITDLGFKVKSEVGIEEYTADLVINELGMIVEVDGPSHRKIKGGGKLIDNENDPKASKRDKKLLSYYPNGIFHVSVDIDEETFKRELGRILKS
jgi:hypothetical protein